RELEQVLAVVAALRDVICRRGQAVVGLGPGHERGARGVEPRRPVMRRTAGCGAARQDDDRSIQAHLDLQVALRSAVIGARAGRGSGEGVADRSEEHTSELQSLAY